MKKKLVLIFCFILALLDCKAQTQSDVNVSEGGYGMVKTNLGLSYDHGFGNLQNGFSSRISYEFFKKRKFTLSANARYTSSQLSFREADLSDEFNPDIIGLNGIHVMGQIGFTASFRCKIFDKPIMAIAMLNSEWGQSGFARVSGIAMGLIMLRANKDTQFGIGPLLMLNSTSKLPAFLIFMYRHRFNNKWSVNMYGGIFGVEYNPTKNNLLSVGADVDVKAFYFKPNNQILPEKCRFTSTSFRPMVKYRHRLLPNLYIEAQSGIAIKMSCRVNGVHGRTEYIECHQKNSPFLQVGASYAL